VGAAPAAAGEGPAEPNATVTLTPDGLKTKANMNAYRKIFHACSGVALACTYDLFLTRAQAAAVFGASFVVLTIIEVLRLRYAQNAISKFLFARFRKIARDYETDQLSGMVYYMAGVTLTVAAYPKKVGVLAILFLALGDPFASSVGIKFGKLGPRFSNGKSLFGSLGGLTICALTTAIYFSRGVQDYLTLAIVSLLGGLAAAIPETLCGRITNGKGGPIDVDDNLAVPIGAGLLLTVFLRCLFPALL